jgi:hypothetical protein
MWYVCLVAINGLLASASRMPPAEPTVHYLNTNRVSVNANVDVGPSGLTRASLYYKDGTLEWKKFEEEMGPLPAPPTSSPDKKTAIPISFNFRAPRNGPYEFIIVVQNAHNTNRAAPTASEHGEVRVVVDTLKPEVSIYSAKVVRDGDTGTRVDITWGAKDANLGATPIKLEYRSVHPDRPGEAIEWKAITPDWIENSGKHSWAIPKDVGYQVLIRIVCKDRAGNEVRAETAAPITVDLAVPAVRNINVAPTAGFVLDVTAGPRK